MASFPCRASLIARSFPHPHCHGLLRSSSSNHLLPANLAVALFHHPLKPPPISPGRPLCAAFRCFRSPPPLASHPDSSPSPVKCPHVNCLGSRFCLHAGDASCKKTNSASAPSSRSTSHPVFVERAMVAHDIIHAIRPPPLIGSREPSAAHSADFACCVGPPFTDHVAYPLQPASIAPALSVRSL